MQSFVADIGVPDDIDREYGEGWLSFIWPDPMYGTERLSIDLQGHCSRRMPIRSGQGPPSFVEVGRNRIKMRFPAELAKKLELDEEIEIEFAINDQDFEQLQRTIDYFNGFPAV
jgi:hypothetical protein